MSRQMKTQTRKRKSSRVDKNACLLVIILIFSGILTFLLLTASDNRRLNSTLNETFDFVKTRIERYEIYNTNDQVKSLVRLLDKTTELSRVIAQEGKLSAEMLDEYAREQRLTGILVLDQHLNVLEQTANDRDVRPLWQKLIESDYVRDITEHPEKTYTTRLRNEGKRYDFAAVARQDTPGILIAYAQKEEVSELNGDLTMASLFADFPFEMNGSVVICDTDEVVSTNKQELVSHSVEESKALYKNEFKAGENGVVRLRSKTGNWCGRREKIKDYDAYIFFPAAQVYLTRTIVCVIYVLLALLLFLLSCVSRSRTEKRSILQDQKRLCVINALGHAYTSISLVNLKTEEIEIIKDSENMKPDQKGDILSKARREELIQQVIAEPFQEAYREFSDRSTVAKRLEDREALSFTVQMTDGKWLTMIIVPQGYDKDGKLCTVLVANRDVTEEKEREIEQDKNLRNALAVAEHANRAKTAFLNNMSHDIRTPMNAVIGFTALATTHIDNKELVLDYLKKIHTSGEHLLSLINDILDMSRIESGSVQIEYTTVHLPDILQDLRTIIAGSVYSKKQKLHIDIQNVCHEDIITDKLRLMQVLLNIIGNAVKFTPMGGMICVCVSEQPCKKDGYATVVFRVKDNGIGMSPEFQEHVFDSFAREHTVTENGIGGTGLGMAITKNIVDMMGGTIRVESEVGKGTEFTVMLACEISELNPEQKEAIKNKKQENRTESRRSYKGKKILLVEDNELNREIATAIMQEIGLDVDIAEDGTDAVNIMSSAEGRSYDLIFMDIQMPKMDGYTATREIRTLKDPKCANIPIVAMTANAFEEDREKAIRAGMNGHIAKPISTEVILEKLSLIEHDWACFKADCKNIQTEQ